ncbi:arylsulfatase [Pseudactinotalea sp. Z1732]|uniref:arylsulfatase n=1 Tax=Pseudactinotalea sp. Z1732 TaxID=3413026 RepID=UPI003C7C442C
MDVTSQEVRPNILLITTDQHRGDTLGVEGHPVVQTPNLDWLARSGTRFRRAYSETPSCVPARRTLMSGQEPAAHGMVGMTSVDWHPAYTLPGELSRTGYQTRLIGKLHLEPKRKRYGFDHLELADTQYEYAPDEPDFSNDYVDWLRTQADGSSIGPAVAHGVNANSWVSRPSHLPEHQTHTFWCASRAIEFLAKRDPSAPFFLNLSFLDPHPPLTPPTLYYERYMSQELPGPVVGDWADEVDPAQGADVMGWRLNLDSQRMKQARAGYYGLINHVDDQVGRVVDFLRRHKLLADTMIIFTSDHGEMLGDHNLYRKTFPYEASARVPFFITPPASLEIPSDIVSELPVGLQDVLPTVFDAAGIPIPEAVTGRSLMPIVRGQGPVEWRSYLHGEHSGHYDYVDGAHFLTDGQSKYIWFSQTGREQFFDISTDPHELRDLTLGSEWVDLEPWRAELASRLQERPGGVVENGQLVPARPHDKLLPHHMGTA